MTGALGTLGVLTEVSLKCLPLPKAETTRVFECSADEAIRMTNEWGGKPLPVIGDLPSRGPARGAPVRRRAGGRRRGREDRRQRAAGRRRRRFWRRRARADAAVLRRGARGRRAAVAAVGQVDGAVHGSRRRAADRMGRRAALARRRTSAPTRRRSAPGRAATAATRRCSARPTRPPAPSSRCRTRRCTALHSAARRRVVRSRAGILNPRPAVSAGFLSACD